MSSDRATLAPGQWRRVRLSAIQYRCARCGETSLSVSREPGARAEPPARCGACKAPRWDRPAGPVGRPRKAKPAV